MDSQHKAYIASIGTISSIGGNAVMTAASVKAGVSGYVVSDYYNQQQKPITLAVVPQDVFDQADFYIEPGEYYSDQYDRILKMAIYALQEAVGQQSIDSSIPLIYIMPDTMEQDYYPDVELLLENLINQKELPLTAEAVSFIASGRAGGILGIENALDYLYHKGAAYVLLGSSDSYIDTARLNKIDEKQRLLASNRMDGFVAGEGAGFLLLTRDPQKAMCVNNHIIALHRPGSAEEPGHLYSSETYLGNGLDSAFKQVFNHSNLLPVDAIYSGMNGENYWAKEYGVACLRNKQALSDNVKTEHPADCYGDLGSATGTVLTGVAALHLLQNNDARTQLVYASADTSQRAAVVMEKVCLETV